MGKHKPEDIRSIAITAHGGAGKTSLTEAMLFNNGDTTRLGSIEGGNTVSDFTSEEQKRQISINNSLVTMERNDKVLYVLDTPGYADFIGDMRSSMRVADSTAIVVSGLHGVEVQTGKAWEFAEEFKSPLMFYVSKLGRENSDFDRTVSQIQEELSDKAIPLFLPIGHEEAFKGVVDLLRNRAYVYKADGSSDFETSDIPEEVAEAASNARESLVETIVEADDELMMMYLEGEEISEDDLFKTFRQAIVERRIFPIIPGSSTLNVGVTQFLDTLTEFFPSPLEGKPRHALDGEEELDIAPDPDGAFSALCFKIMVDPFVGKLSFIRVNSGSATTDNPVYNVNREEEERVSSFKSMLGKEGKDLKNIVVGDIIAIPKLHSTHVGDTLAIKGTTFHFPPIQFPQPVYSVAVEAKSRADEDKLSSALHRMLEEDPTLKFEKNVDTGDNVLSGMGDLHLDIVLSRIKERYGVELDTRTPQVPYKETIRKTAKAQGKHKKQSGGRGQYGDVHIEFSPKKRGEGFEFEDKIVGGAIPKGYIPAVEKGLNEVIKTGVLAGYPCVDFKASLFFGSYHDVDSSEMAFKIAAHMAFKKGMAEASPVLLEPIMNVEVVVPEDYLGDVMGDFNSRRGKIMGIDSKGSLQVVKAQAPLAEMFRYAIILRSMTSGRGTFTMEQSHYENVPDEIIKKIVAARAAEEEKD